MSLRTLIVGGGSIGERHLRCFQQTPPCEVALCEVRDELRERLREQYGLSEVFGSVEEAAKKSWDIVVICTPAHLHVPHVVTLAGVAKSILIEKPLTTKLEEVPRLLEALKGKTAGVAYVLRGHPAVQEAREIARSGKLGTLLQMTIVTGQHFPTFRPAYREIYYKDRATGGGAIQDAVTHMCDMVQYLAGDFDWVFCDASHQALPGVEVEDTVHVVGRAAKERVMVSVALNQFMAPNEVFVHLNGSEGSVEIRMHEARWGVLRHGEADWSWTPFPIKERDDLFRMQAGHFARAAQGEEPVLCSVEEAERTLRVNLACLESAGKRRIELLR